ncbi:hypothetical protein Tco_0842922 [Tanacetum coccineum]|uniref:Uncharacterized protein n=1 Tax=Tanacetum coccineum TaxID=301880 RepID=A0ABQ5B0L9_9ASTR
MNPQRKSRPDIMLRHKDFPSVKYLFVYELYVTNLSRIISSITAQQTNLELVPKEKRLEIGKCNRRLNPGKKQREPTFQVILDALSLTRCYSAFLITADVLEVYMHQFWDSIHKYENSYMFKMDKKKKFDLNLEIFRDIFQICPRVYGQNLDELPTDEDIMSFFKELGHAEEIKTITNIVVDQMHQPWRTFSTIINRSLSKKITGLDKLHLFRAQILWGMYYKKNVDYVELLWEDFTYQIDNRGHKKQDKIYYPRFTKVIIHHFLTKDKTISKRNKIGMHTSRDDYLINTLRFISTKEESQIYGARLPKSMTSLKMRETKAYKCYRTSPEEPIRKSTRVKRHAKKSSIAPTTGVVIRKTHVKSLSKKKEKMTVEKCKGINSLSKVALTEEAQYEEVQKKSLRDFHKTHPSVSGIVTKIAPSAGKNQTFYDNNNDHDSRSEGSDQERDSGDDNTQSNSEKGLDFEHETDENFVKTPSVDTDHEDETKIKDKAEGDEDEGIDYATNQFDDDVDLRMNEPVTTDEWFIQKEGTDAEMTNVQQGNENLEITLNQVIEDAHVTLSTIPHKTEVPVTSSSHSSDLESKYLNFSDIPHKDAEIISPMDVHVHHEVPSNQTPILLTVPVSVITESSPIFTTVIPQSLPSFTPPPQQSTLTTKATNPLSTLPNFTSVFQFTNIVTALGKEVTELKKE